MEDLEKLGHYEQTRVKTRLPMEVKPCLMNMLNGNAPGLIRQGINAFIMGCELYRVGRTQEQIEKTLTEQDIKPSQIRSILKSTSKDIYQYGCPKLEELGLCIYEDRFECPWFDKIPRQSQKEWKERDFWRYGWPIKLGTAKSMLYLALREVEKIRGYQAGSRLYVSWDKLQEVSGVSRDIIAGRKATKKRKLIKPGLEVLKELGLITYRPGKKRAKGEKGLASQISRVIPIPKPP